MKNTCHRIFRKVRRILLCCIVVILMAFFYKHYDATEYSVDNEQEYIDRVCNIAGVPALSVAVWDNENGVLRLKLQLSNSVYYGNTSAGYLISDTYDLMKWLKNVKILLDFDSFPISSKNQYFAGWNIYDSYVCHGGNNPNYSSQVYVDRNEPLGVFVLSAKVGSSASTIGDALFRIHHGEKIKIGMYIDFFEILDLLFVTIPLIVLYAILWLPYDSKDKVVIRFIIGLVIILAFAAFLLVSPISYRYCFVWFPGSLVFFVGFMVIISSYLITRSILCLIKR